MNMEGIIYLTLDQAIVIHKKTIQYSGGGTYEHFDLGRLESVLQNIQNDDYYPTFEEKLTHLFYCTCLLYTSWSAAFRFSVMPSCNAIRRVNCSSMA